MRPSRSQNAMNPFDVSGNNGNNFRMSNHVPNFNMNFRANFRYQTHNALSRNAFFTSGLGLEGQAGFGNTQAQAAVFNCPPASGKYMAGQSRSSIHFQNSNGRWPKTAWPRQNWRPQPMLYTNNTNQDVRMEHQKHYTYTQSCSRSKLPTSRTSFTHSSDPHGSNRFTERMMKTNVGETSNKTIRYQHRYKKNKKHKTDSCQITNLCNKHDYDCNTEWAVTKVRNLDQATHNEKTLFVSMSEPVICFLKHSTSFLPHCHIKDPFYLNPHQIGRRIKPISMPKDISCNANDFKFSVLSYNILSDKLLNNNKQLYFGYPEWLLDWEYRKHNLLKEMLNYNADIICLQEVEEDAMSSFFNPLLKEEGYVGVFKKRTGGKSDGCAIFYRGDRFDIIECRELEYKIREHPIMDRDNVGIVLKLESKPNIRGLRAPLLVANTHLLFNKNRGDIKLLQMASLLAEIEEIARVQPPFGKAANNQEIHSPVIICGDLNSVPFSPLYNFIVNGRLQYDVLSKKHISGQNSPHKLRYESSYLGKQLIPNDLGISALCQKNNALTPRTNERNENVSVDSKSIEANDCYIVQEKIDGKKIVMEEPGVLKHLMKFRSAYGHKLDDGRAEVSTCHSEDGACVDYILFSQGLSQVFSKNIDGDNDIFINIEQCQLYLTSILTLLGNKEVSAMGSLPNIYLSSDHLSLLATFKLLASPS